MKQIHLFSAATFILLVALNSCNNKAGKTAKSIRPQQYSILQLQPQSVSVYTDYPATLQGEEVVEIRPKAEDVQEAEYAFRHAFELTNVAKTYFYPSLTISGTAGWATANTLQSFFNGTFYGSLLGGLTQPVFNRGLNKQRLRIAEATQQEAYYSFQAALLTAGREVSNALYAYQKGVEEEALRKAQISSLATAVDYTQELLKYTSATNYTDVLTAQQNLLSAQLNSISDKLQQLQAVVELYRALGGGWRRD